MLSLAEVCYRWPHSSKGIGPISAEIPEGTLVGLIGPNGAGKSTLLKLIAAFLKPSAGRIDIRGTDVTTLSAAERAKRLALVPQTLETSFDLTVKEVVELGGLSRLTWRDRMGLAPHRDVPLLERIFVETEITDLRHRPFNTLSGGEAKRTLLASALAQAASLLLLDEPTAHLDPGHAIKFLDLVRTMVERQRTTVLMAYHDLATVGLYADTLWVIHEGQLVMTGAPDEVLTSPLIASIYGADLMPVSHPRTKQTMLIFP